MEGRNRPTRIRGSSPELLQFARDMRDNPTPAEAVLWAALSGQPCGTVKFRFQHPLGQVILDFYCPAWKLVVELDGDVHRGREEEDAARTRHLETYGCRVIRFENAEVLTDLELVLARIREAGPQSPPAPNSGGEEREG